MLTRIWNRFYSTSATPKANQTKILFFFNTEKRKNEWKRTKIYNNRNLTHKRLDQIRDEMGQTEERTNKQKKTEIKLENGNKKKKRR